MIQWLPAPRPYRGPFAQWLRRRTCKRKGHDVHRQTASRGGVPFMQSWCLRCGYEESSNTV